MKSPGWLLPCFARVGRFSGVFGMIAIIAWAFLPAGHAEPTIFDRNTTVSGFSFDPNPTAINHEFMVPVSASSPKPSVHNENEDVGGPAIGWNSGVLFRGTQTGEWGTPWAPWPHEPWYDFAFLDSSNTSLLNTFTFKPKVGGYWKVSVDAAASWWAPKMAETTTAIWRDPREPADRQKEAQLIAASLDLAMGGLGEEKKTDGTAADPPNEEDPGVTLVCGDQMAASLSACPSDQGSVTLSATGTDKIRIWADTLHTQEITLPKTWTFSGTGVVLPGSVWVEGLQLGEAAKDVVLTEDFNINGSSFSDKVNLTVIGVNLTVDSNNDGKIDGEDDKIENNADEPGNLLQSSDGDADLDGVPDWADGFNISDGDNPSDATLSGDGVAKFAKLQTKLYFGANKNRCKVTFSYHGTDPAGVSCANDAENGFTYGLPYCGCLSPVHLRIWKKDSTEARNPASVSDDGDFVTPGEAYNWNDLNPDTLYVEGIGAGEASISVNVTETNANGDVIGSWSDTVKVTVVKVEFLTPEGPVDFLDVCDPYPTIQLGELPAAPTLRQGQKTFTFHLTGTVRDPISDNLSESSVGIDNISASVDGVAGPSTSCTRKAPNQVEAPTFWRQHPYEATFDLPVTVPVQAGTHWVEVKTAANKAGNEGKVTILVSLSRTVIPGQPPTPPGGGGDGASNVLNLQLPSGTTPTTLDTMDAFSGTGDPASSNPTTLTESGAASLVFTGTVNGSTAIITVLRVFQADPLHAGKYLYAQPVNSLLDYGAPGSGAVFSTTEVDKFIASICYESNAGTISLGELKFVETAPDARIFRANVNQDNGTGTTGGSGGTPSRETWSCSIGNLGGNDAGTYSPFIARISHFKKWENCQLSVQETTNSLEETTPADGWLYLKGDGAGLGPVTLVNQKSSQPSEGSTVVMVMSNGEESSQTLPTITTAQLVMPAAASGGGNQASRVNRQAASGNNEETTGTLPQRLARVAKSPKHLVTHDPAWEKTYVKSNTNSSARYQQAALMGNEAVFYLPLSENERANLHVELWSDGFWWWNMEKICDIPIQDDCTVRISTKDGASGAKTDVDGNIYVNQHMLPWLGPYRIYLCNGDKTITSFPIEIGPLLTGLSSPAGIISADSPASFDPYTDKFDMSHLSGLGLEITFASLAGDVAGGLTIPEKDDKTWISFDYVTRTGASAGTHYLQLTGKEKHFGGVKWEGFDSNITDEKTLELYGNGTTLTREQSKSSDKDSPNKELEKNELMCPVYVISETPHATDGTHSAQDTMHLDLTPKDDPTQHQKIDVKFGVEYLKARP